MGKGQFICAGEERERKKEEKGRRGERERERKGKRDIFYLYDTNNVYD
uniref:Uncharacterized protein n=1 Tax=Wuchereria bancrofti TaxID=6293 RepID=A0AAF5PIY3_WUCBA